MFKDYWKTLTAKEKKRFCELSKVSINTIKCHYLSEPQERRTPRNDTIARMHLASIEIGKSILTTALLVDYFTQQQVDAIVEEAKAYAITNKLVAG